MSVAVSNPPVGFSSKGDLVEKNGLAMNARKIIWMREKLVGMIEVELFVTRKTPVQVKVQSHFLSKLTVADKETDDMADKGMYNLHTR